MNTYGELLPSVDSQYLETVLDKLEALARECVRKVVRGNSVLAYSGGIDSSILAELVRSEFGKADLLTLGTRASSDTKYVKQDQLSRRDGFNMEIREISRADVEGAAKEVSELAEVDNLSHFEDCVSFWLAAKAVASRKDVKFILSANGPDELFCGYDRFRRIVDMEGYAAVDLEITNSVAVAYLLKTQVNRVIDCFDLETREPFLEKEFIDYAAILSPELKILKGNDLLRKRIWRSMGRRLGLPEEIVLRRKKAMQYGMGVHAITCSMLKRGTLKLDFENKAK